MSNSRGSLQLLTYGRIGLETGYYKVAYECFEQVLELDAANQEALDGLVRIEGILLHKGPVGVPAWLKEKRLRKEAERQKEEKTHRDWEEEWRRKWIEAYGEEKREKRKEKRKRVEEEERQTKEEERRKRVEEEERQRREQRERSRRAKERTKTETRSKPGDKSPYDILNVKPNATKEEIVAAYRRMAQMYHPDKTAGLGPEFRELAEEHMKAINAAYAVLGDPERRAQYDRMRPTQDGAKVDSTIIVSEDEIVIGGRKITLPCSLDTLSRSIGPPSRMFSLEWTVYVWDELGINAREPSGAGIVSVSLEIGRGAFHADFSPKSLYGGSVQIGSYVLNVASDVKDLRAEGFIQNGIFIDSWQRWLGKFNLLVGTNQSTQKIASLDISVQDGVDVDSTIIVSEDEIVIGWRKMTLPCSLDTLSRSIGPPSRIFPGTPPAWTLYVWDELGIKAHEFPEVGIVGIVLFIGRRDIHLPFPDLPRSPKNLYGSFVQIGNYVLTVVSDAKDLRTAGFMQEDLPAWFGRPVRTHWKRRLGKFALAAEIDQGTQRIAGLAIGLYVPRRT